MIGRSGPYKALTDVGQTAWLIAPTTRHSQCTAIPNSFLGVTDQTCLGMTACDTRLVWVHTAEAALKFAQERDAQLFVDLMCVLSDKLPHAATLRGLRSGDPRPLPVEHRWVFSAE